jgi:drug/metabolite transporter (DMT)-like permease
MIQVYEIMAFVAAITVSFAMMFTKRAYAEGAKQNHILVATTVFQPFIYITLIVLNGEPVVNWGQIHWTLIYSVLLAIGMLVGFKSINMGDASIISPIMGSKVVFVAIGTYIFSIGSISNEVIISVVLCVISIIFLGIEFKKTDIEKQDKYGKDIIIPILLALIAITFLGISDIVIQEKAPEMNKLMFMLVGSTVVAAFFLIKGYITDTRIKTVSKSVKKWIWLSGISNGGTGILLAVAIAYYGHATEFNIIMGSRGVISVIAVALFANALKLRESKKSKITLFFRLLGSVCILVATALVLGE